MTLCFYCLDEDIELVLIETQFFLHTPYRGAVYLRVSIQLLNESVDIHIVEEEAIGDVEEEKG